MLVPHAQACCESERGCVLLAQSAFADMDAGIVIDVLHQHGYNADVAMKALMALQVRMPPCLFYACCSPAMHAAQSAA